MPEGEPEGAAAPGGGEPGRLGPLTDDGARGLRSVSVGARPGAPSPKGITWKWKMPLRRRHRPVPGRRGALAPGLFSP
jgi:hypothetical protein